MTSYQISAKTETTTTTAITKETTISSTNGTVVLPAEPVKPVYYELVQENLKPEPDEFYVNSIFTIKNKPKVSIARSQNKRAGDLYDSYVNYSVGDYVTSEFKIVNIDPKLKEVIILKEGTDQYYVLTMSYGTATSRLARIKNYKSSNR
jgi:hypothetical protein